MTVAHLGVLIGRFQPLHQGHCHLIETALKNCDALLIVIGSADRARSFKNPWNAAERQAVIQTQFLQAPLYFAAIPDFFYSEGAWIDAVRHSVNALQPKAVTLFGHDKDSSTYYLQEFPAWQTQALANFKGISATGIRQDYFWDDHISKDVPAATLHFLEQFRQTADFVRLQEEGRFVRDYQKSWSHSPYPPLFVTTDALVVCAEHILLIKRKFCPGRGLYAMPGGFLEAQEWIKTGLCRELFEETRIALDTQTLIKHLKKIQVFDYPDRSLIGRVVTHVGHFELPAPFPKIEAADDALSVEWIPLTALPSLKDAFHDDHYQIITTLLECLVSQPHFLR